MFGDPVDVWMLDTSTLVVKRWTAVSSPTKGYSLRRKLLDADRE